MNFFFAYNVAHINYEGIVLKYQPLTNNWKVVKPAIVSFGWDVQKQNCCVKFQAQKSKIIKTSIHQVFMQNNSNDDVIFFRLTHKNSLYSFTFKYKQTFLEFKKFHKIFLKIQTEIENFQNNQENFDQLIAKTAELSDQFILNGYDMVSFCVLYQNNQEFKQYFEISFKQKLVNSIQNQFLDKCLKQFTNFANIFKFTEQNFLKMMLINDESFSFVKNIIFYFQQNIQNFVIFQDENFNKKSCQNLNLLNEIKHFVDKDDIKYFDNLKFLITEFLVYFYDEKYLQQYVSMLENLKQKIYKQIINKQQNVQIISQKISNNKFQYFDFALDLLYTFSQEQKSFGKTINFLNSIHFMDFIRRILVKIEFQNFENKIIAQVNNNRFSDEKQFQNFLEFTCQYIMKNPQCFITQIFHQNQRCEHFTSLKFLVLMYFQDNYNYSEFLSLETILNVINNIRKLKEDEQDDYLETMGDIIKSTISKYPFIQNDIRFLKLLECLISKKEEIILKKIFQNKEIQKNLIYEISNSRKTLKKIIACKILNYLIINNKIESEMGVDIYKLQKVLQQQKIKKHNLLQRQYFQLSKNLEKYLEGHQLNLNQRIIKKINLHFLINEQQK